MRQILVIGGISIDTLHLVDRCVTSAGGAGMYTAMAARRCGVHVALFAVHPTPCPSLLLPVAERLTDCLGPQVAPEAIPHIEISYQHGKTDYLDIRLGKQEALTVDMLPDDLSGYELVHIIPIGGHAGQLAFIKACRQRGARRISAGTYPVAAAEEPEAVRAAIAEADYFFMNRREAAAVFGAPESAATGAGQVLFVTMGADGACVIQGDLPTLIPAAPADQLDPTGAGDTFCGAALAFLAQHHHPIMAARRATVLAAAMIAEVGPNALLADAPPPDLPGDWRVRIDADRLRQVAGAIAAFPVEPLFAFTGPQYPPLGHPHTLDYFFAATLQQFSFWTASGGRYERPLIASVGGVERKGSDYLWAAYTRRLALDPDFCSPLRQANLSQDELAEVLRADDGQQPMPALDLHVAEARRYGRTMLALRMIPQSILREALDSGEPLQTFRDRLCQVGGYDGDPLAKKANLLALILNQRPEQFLPLRTDEQVPPIVDYHLLRSALRTGLVEVLDQALVDKLRRREIVTADEEWAVRYPTYLALENLVAESGRNTGLVDGFFFNARRRCPEMATPHCADCAIGAVCAQRLELFQPVLRTTFY